MFNSKEKLLSMSQFNFESSIVSSFSRDINSVQPASSMCTGPDGSLYVCYVAGDLTVRLAKRTGEIWNEVVVCTQNDDAHQTGCVAVDCKGHIHVVAKTHNCPISYWKSSKPGDIHSLIAVAFENSLQTFPSVSYPILTRAGNYLWLTCRIGTSGLGETYTAVYQYDSQGVGYWKDVHLPLLSGISVNPPDSQYLGCARGLGNGNLALVWTYRVSEDEPVNRGLFFAQLDPLGSVGDASGFFTPLTYPIDRNSARFTIIPPEDKTLTNSGLAVEVTPNGFHVVFNKHSPQGFREIYHAKFRVGKWIVSQVTNHKRQVTPSTSVCTIAPLPCDMSLQGPQMICKDEKVALFYTIPTREPRVGAWSRLPGELHIAVSSNEGDTWEHCKYDEDIKQRTGEFQRESSGQPLLLHQSVSSPNGVLKVIDVNPILDMPSPTLKIHADLNGSCVEIPSSSGYGFETGFSLRFRFQPKRNAIMCLGSKDQHFRVFYFGENGNPGNLFNTPGNLQIGLNENGSAQYANVGQMSAGERVDLILIWNAGVVDIYRDGNHVETNGPIAGIESTSPLVLGGMIGYPQYSFAGSLKFDYYSEVLTSEQVGLLYCLD